MLSRAQRLGPSHFVVFVQTGKTWEVVQASCNKREFLYLSLQRLNTANHITAAGRGDFLSPPPKVSGLLLSLFLWLVLPWLPANKRAEARDIPCPESSNPAPLQSTQPLCWERGLSTSWGCAHTTHCNCLAAHSFLGGSSGN